jgi:hypothetical protein
MTRFVVGDDRSQTTLFPERLDDYLGEDNPVRAVDVFVDELDLAELGFGGVEPEAGAVAGWGLHPLESAAFARRTPHPRLQSSSDALSASVSPKYRFSRWGRALSCATRS